MKKMKYDILTSSELFKLTGDIIKYNNPTPSLLVQKTGKNRTSLTDQLSVLHKYNIVKKEREGNSINYSIDTGLITLYGYEISKLLLKSHLLKQSISKKGEKEITKKVLTVLIKNRSLIILYTRGMQDKMTNFYSSIHSMLLILPSLIKLFKYDKRENNFISRFFRDLELLSEIYLLSMVSVGDNNKKYIDKLKKLIPKLMKVKITKKEVEIIKELDNIALNTKIIK